MQNSLVGRSQPDNPTPPAPGRGVGIGGSLDYRLGRNRRFMRCDFCECHVDKLHNCGDYDLCFHCMEEVQSWFDELIFWEEE